MSPAKKARGRPPAANKVTKPAQRTTKGSAAGKLAAAIGKAGEEAVIDISSKAGGKASKRGRKPAEKIEIQQEEDEDEDEDAAAGAVDSMVETEEDTTPPVMTTTAKARGRPKAAATIAMATDASKEMPGSITRGIAKSTKRGRRAGTKPIRDEESEIPETQAQDGMDIDTEGDDHFDELPVPRPSTHRVDRASGNLDLEASDVQIRRRLGDAIRKYDNLAAKYRDLRDIGVKAAERNFDNLKKESEERATTANELIAHLKADLAEQRSLAKEGQQRKKQLEEMEAKLSALTASLSEAKQESKTLSTRLAASRSAEAAASAKVPGSAVKGGSAAARAIASSDVVQTGQLKEDLYGDLTGLIVRVTKRDSAGQVFDCIQTGRNGTLHFKLEVENESSGENYEEAHFTYKPQLDSNRDRDLIDMLPDFLVEEIEFPRPHAAKFYARVIKSLTEQLD
ncbi:chromosome segregation protein [Colletotrichum orchidophilum]|uniref:Chromosome segregation protein n=1 Tax=Colletotrichum orchidophilum TaxID=1209926 RepID=A0A1G4BPP7_9PEZI|nr:chromosome segregation protein [Colletotrichum orchidophilum]OHF03394.1 chromosome segregation protein [Colletotrichum orchidophilum]